MRVPVNICLAILFSIVKGYGQNDPQAVDILNKFSENALSAPSVSMKFRMISNDQVENTRDSVTGSIVISKDKYELDLGENIIWFNGETSWNYLKAENEVTINNADKKDNSFLTRPSSIFTLYKTGFKIRLVEEKSAYCIIDLYPEDLKSEFTRIRLSIGKTPVNLRSLVYKRTDGIIITINITDYNLKLKPDPHRFVFHPEKYKGVEIVDMR